MVKITVSGKPDETQKTLDYLKNLEKIGEIMVTKTKTTQIKDKDTIHYLYIHVNNETNRILEEMNATN